MPNIPNMSGFISGNCVLNCYRNIKTMKNYGIVGNGEKLQINAVSLGCDNKKQSLSITQPHNVIYLCFE